MVKKPKNIMPHAPVSHFTSFMLPTLVGIQTSSPMDSNLNIMFTAIKEGSDQKNLARHHVGVVFILTVSYQWTHWTPD